MAQFALLTGETECGVGDNLVELDMRVERNVQVENCLAKSSDHVSTHCQKKQRERERHSGGGATCQADSVACYTAQSSVFVLHGVLYVSLRYPYAHSYMKIHKRCYMHDYWSQNKAFAWNYNGSDLNKSYTGLELRAVGVDNSWGPQRQPPINSIIGSKTAVNSILK